MVVIFKLYGLILVQLQHPALKCVNEDEKISSVEGVLVNSLTYLALHDVAALT